jgi:hypothetical protein
MIRRMTSSPTLPPMAARLGRVGLGAVIAVGVLVLVAWVLVWVVGGLIAGGLG